jgi:hypothetical protein
VDSLGIFCEIDTDHVLKKRVDKGRPTFALVDSVADWMPILNLSVSEILQKSLLARYKRNRYKGTLFMHLQ